MSVLLPNSAKYAFFIDSKQPFHHEWDVNWSFTFKLLDPSIQEIYLTDESNNIISTENNDSIILDISPEEYGFCTFLTKSPTISSFLLGHYMGFFKNLSALNGEVAIAFDKTGLFALSSTTYPLGISRDNLKSNALIIRDSTGVVYNESLDDFPLPNTEDKTLRFRFINKNEICVEHRTKSNIFKEFARVSVNTTLSGNDKLYPAFFYTSPVSSSATPNSSFFLKNFHVQGNISNPTYL